MRCGVFVHEDLPLIVRVEHKYEVLGSCRRRSSFIRLTTELKIDLTTIEPTVANVDENLVSHDERVAGRPKKSKPTSMQPNSFQSTA